MPANWQSATPFLVFFVLCCFPVVSPALALFLGIALSLLYSNANFTKITNLSNLILRTSVVGLGFGVKTDTLIEAGKNSVLTTAFFVCAILSLGMLIGKILKIESKISLLISAGTAICGGSAIAAVGTAIDANSKQLSVASATVFCLNALALFIFPVVGHWLHLSQFQFGTWAAIAIHDTSSVVGAASKYGEEALTIATTTKLVRVVWIIPLAFISALPYWKRGSKIKFPFFILFFVTCSVIASELPAYMPYFNQFYSIAKQGLTLSLFLIGTSITKDTIKEIGSRPLIQGAMLWIITAVGSLIFVLLGA